MLAMDVNDDAGYLRARGARKSIASKLAPTGGIAVIVTAALKTHSAQNG